MQKIEKIRFINEYDMLNSIKEDIERFNSKDINNVLKNIKNEVEKSLNSYPNDLYTQYKDEINKEYENDIEGLKKFIGSNLAEIVEKVLWFKSILSKNNQ